MLFALTAATAAAQSTEAADRNQVAAERAAAAAARLPEAKRTTKIGKPVLPDPDLLDGSSYDKEKRPLYGMLSEIEMGEEEGPPSDKVSPNSGPGNGQTPPDPKDATKPGGGGPPKPDQPPGSEEKVPEGPAAPAGGAQAQKLTVPEGAGGKPGAPGAKPRDLQIGDATLQIQTAKQNPDVVGSQSSNSQQYEKKVPAGGSTTPSSGNQGAEKGRVVPKGL